MSPLLPTFTEAFNTVHWIGVLLAFSTVLAVFCVALALLLDWYEERRQDLLQQIDAKERAIRRRAKDEAASWERLMIDARASRMAAFRAHEAEERYYQHALKTASEPGPWPPVKDLRDGRGFGPWPPPRRLQ